MPIAVGWFDKQRTLIGWQLVGAWSWREFERGINAELALRRQSPLPSEQIDVLVDVRRSALTVSNLLPNVRRLTLERIPPRGLILVVGGGALARWVIDQLRRHHPDTFAHYYACDTLDDALALRAAQRSQ
jgi:hypothetical protein